jgi:hypothetical protein
LDKTDPKELLVYHNRIATAPKLSHRTNVLEMSSEESSEEPIISRRGSRQKRGTTSRKASGITTASLSGRNSTVGIRWKVVGEENGECIAVSAEQMTNAEKLAMEIGMSEEVIIENAGTPYSLWINECRSWDC